ncbi:MAG: GDP-L-fucose synthase [Bacteroidia bacterium]|nr:GDP-L-fucose synthase [Bacteroidia bacterium]
MKKSSKIYIAGHKGLVGSAITKCLEKKGYNNLLFRTFAELDLTNQNSVDSFFEKEQPEYVFLAAALVGGIMANNTLRADFIFHNMMIQSNVIHASWKYKVKKLLFLGSTCIYPKNAPQPLKEDFLLTSPLEYTNEPYAIAKIAGLKMCESFNLQYKTNFISLMPTNLYGPGDNYDLEKSHVIPALLRKIHLGKCLEEGNWTAIRKDLNKNPVEKINGDFEPKIIMDILKKYGIQIIQETSLNSHNVDLNYHQNTFNRVAVNVWGTGTPLREFMYSLDMAEACVFVMENVDISDIIDLNQSVNQTDYHSPHFINIGTEEEISIKDLALRIKSLTGFKGEIVFDVSKPDGTMRKITDVRVLKKLGYIHKFNLDKGLAETYNDYLK